MLATKCYSVALMGLLFTPIFVFSQEKEPEKTTIPKPANLQKKNLPEPTGKDIEFPSNVKDLEFLQKRVQDCLKKVDKAVVGIQIGSSAGSGVIISADGYVLTAGHVSGDPNRQASIIMPDGKRLRAKTLGWNKDIDSGLIKIEEKGDFPHVDVGESKLLKKGQWVVSIGHPGGFQPGRAPVVRVGRILERNASVIRFDLEGRVIGIHSRIGPLLNLNYHVPVDTYRDTWDRLVSAEIWGGNPLGSLFGQRDRNLPWLGIVPDQEKMGLRISEVVKGSPAEKAGIVVGDVLLKIAETELKTPDELTNQLRKRKIGQEIVLTVIRKGEELEIRVQLARRPE
jgi:serine protease Do